MKEAVGLGGRPGERLIDRARVDQSGQPLAALGCALHGHEKVEERVPVTARRRFLESTSERAVLHLAGGGRANRVGGEEREGMLIVAAVLSQM